MAKGKNKAGAAEAAKAKGAARGPKKLAYWEGNVPDQFCFYASDGKVVKNLKDLVKAIDQMTDDVFNYHANKEKNDFSNWIRDVMQYHDLAHNILGKSRHSTKEAIVLYVKKKSK